MTNLSVSNSDFGFQPEKEPNPNSIDPGPYLFDMLTELSTKQEVTAELLVQLNLKLEPYRTASTMQADNDPLGDFPTDIQNRVHRLVSQQQDINHILNVLISTLVL